MIYAGVAVCILAGVALWLYATNERRARGHIAAELSAPVPYRQTVAPSAYLPEIETVKPAGATRSLQADVLVPMAQAGFSGVVGALLAGLLAYGLQAANVLPWAGFGFALGLAGVWTLNLWQSHRLLWIVERVTHADLDNDQHIGPPPEPGTFTVNRDAAKAKADQAVRTRVRADTLTAYLEFWARCCTSGTAYRRHGITTVGSDAYRAWDTMRREFVSLGLLSWKKGIVGSETAVRVSMEDGVAIIRAHVQKK
jgi:hypothetical protein